jgi:hypothetical protein
MAASPGFAAKSVKIPVSHHVQPVCPHDIPGRSGCGPVFYRFLFELLLDFFIKISQIKPVPYHF